LKISGKNGELIAPFLKISDKNEELIVNAVFAICNISGMYSKRPVQTAK
jgi:hypothetical protein